MENDYKPYVAPVRAHREVQFIGELPHDGAWIMHAVPTSGAKWCIVIADTLGKHEPRIIKDGVMTALKAEYPVPVRSGEVFDANVTRLPPVGAGHTAEERT